MFGQEYGAVLPNQQRNPVDTWMMLRQQEQEQQRYEQHRQDEREANNGKWLLYAAGRLDPSHWSAVGSPYDKTVTSTLDEGMNSVAQHLKDNPDDHVGALTKIGNVIGGVNRYYNAAQNVKAKVDDAVKQYGSNPSVDANKLRALAMTKAFYKYDADNHVIGMKLPEEINADEDIVTPLLGEALTGTDGLYKSIQSLKPREVGKTEETRNARGFTRKIEYTGNIMPYQTVGYDANGDAIPVVKTQKEKFSDGSEAEALHPDAYALVFNDPVSRAIVDKTVQAMGVQPKTKQDLDVLRRVAAKGLLGSYEMGGIRNKEVEKAPIPKVTVVNNNNMGKTAEVNNVFGEIEAEQKRQEGTGAYYTPLSEHTATVQNYILENVNKVARKDTPYTQGALAIARDGKGRLVVVEAIEGKPIPGARPIMALDYTGVNLKTQANSKAKAAVVHQGNEQKATKKNNDPLGLGL